MPRALLENNILYHLNATVQLAILTKNQAPSRAKKNRAEGSRGGDSAQEMFGTNLVLADSHDGLVLCGCWSV